MSAPVSLPPTATQRMTRLIRRLALKPYGDELLTRSADFWIFSARLIIVVMAAAEALAWGYMGSLMARTAPLAGGLIAAAFIFTLVWIIDATFMTLDLSRGFYEPALTGRKPNAAKEKFKLVAGVAARVAIVTASLVITAPFLAQAIFAGDVDDEMSRRNAGTIAAKRQQIDQSFSVRIAELRKEQTTLEQQRVNEAAGTGLSGKYGRGPALETIERQLAEKRRELADLETSRASALAGYDRLSRPQLESQYGLQFVAPGVQSSAALLDDVLRTAEFANAEVAIRAFLAFLFLGLLILKGFQPRSVAIYYSEQLHSVHDEYRKGLFDAYLPAPERADAGATVDPLRFEDWCLSTYATMRKEDERRRATAAEYRIHELLIEQWQRLEKAARAEVEPLIAQHDAAVAAIDTLERELHESRTSAASLSAELARAEAAWASMRQHLDTATLDGPTFEQAIGASRELDERRTTLQLQARNAEASAERCAKRLEARTTEAERLLEEISTKQMVISDAQKRIGLERMSVADTIGAQRTAWTSQTA